MSRTDDDGFASWQLKAQDPILTVLAVAFALESFLSPVLQAVSPAIARTG